ncbi:bacillithiol biosynthesis cysteine-adding enzyme BshC [Urechidicola sp. KH5]
MTKVTSISYQNTGYFSKTICDYLDQADTISPYAGAYPNIKNFQAQIKQKQSWMSEESRNVLADALSNQYAHLTISDGTKENIELLRKSTSFTVTTGHQLNLFTGPLYFLYKIISAINLAEELKQNYPAYDFVPVYWMASEDHDFDEIHYFNYQGKKIAWNREASGGVGRLDSEGLDLVIAEFTKLVGNSDNAKQLVKWMTDAYLNAENLTQATRYLANELFKSYGLVIVDGDDPALKRLFSPYVKQELEEGLAYKRVSETITSFSKNYKVQVNPRAINLFYLTDTIRERIVFEDDEYKVLNTDIRFNQEELAYELHVHPERFSPNVILRPLYQEVILPNLCYIGGGGELAYWFELKSFFDTVKVPFPILLLRNCALLVSEKQEQKMEKLNISYQELFLKQLDLVNKKITEHSDVIIDFSEQRLQIDSHFEMLEGIAAKTDKSFIGAVKAQKQKQLNGLDMLEKRLLKAERRKYKDRAERIRTLQDELFPKQSLQERQKNFSEYYLEYGSDLILTLKESLKPLDLNFTIVTF